MDVVTLFSLVVFSASWFFWARTPGDEPLARLFFAVMMGLAVGVGLLGLANRLLPHP